MSRCRDANESKMMPEATRSYSKLLRSSIQDALWQPCRWPRWAKAEHKWWSAQGWISDLIRITSHVKICQDQIKVILRHFGQRIARIAILGLGASSSFAEPRCHKFSCAQSHPLPPNSKQQVAGTEHLMMKRSPPQGPVSVSDPTSPSTSASPIAMKSWHKRRSFSLVA